MKYFTFFLGGTKSLKLKGVFYVYSTSQFRHVLNGYKWPVATILDSRNPDPQATADYPGEGQT